MLSPVRILVVLLLMAKSVADTMPVVTFAFTGGPQSYTVPNNDVGYLLINACGGASNNANGGYLSTVLGWGTDHRYVRGGTLFYIYVGGGGGTNNYNGGGGGNFGQWGGGGTDLRYNYGQSDGSQGIETRLLVAGGGGGGGTFKGGG